MAPVVAPRDRPARARTRHGGLRELPRPTRRERPRRARRRGDRVHRVQRVSRTRVRHRGRAGDDGLGSARARRPPLHLGRHAGQRGVAPREREARIPAHGRPHRRRDHLRAQAPLMRWWRFLLPDFRPLRASPAYRLLWLGQLVSMSGSQLRLVALPYQVFVLTGSSFAVGLIGLFQAVPLLLLSLFAGVIADAVDLRRLLLFTQVGLAPGSLLLATPPPPHPPPAPLPTTPPTPPPPF